MFDRFVLLGANPRTGSTESWHATDVTTQQRCEIEFYPAVPLNVPAWTDNLRRAATLASQLQHPALDRLLDLRVTPQFTAAIWQTGLGPRSVADELTSERERRVPFVLAASWLEQLAGALDYLHAHQAAHGALALARLSVSPDGRLRLAHSCVINALREIVLQCGQHWDASDELPLLSPQRWDNAPVSPADDIYAFGAIAYWMLTGAPPFSQGDLAQQARSAAVTPIFLCTSPTGAPVQDVPPAWQALINSCLAKLPSQRPPALLNAIRMATASAAPAVPAPAAFPGTRTPPPPVPMPQPFGVSAPTAPMAAPVPPAPVSFAPPAPVAPAAIPPPTLPAAHAAPPSVPPVPVAEPTPPAPPAPSVRPPVANPSIANEAFAPLPAPPPPAAAPSTPASVPSVPTSAPRAESVAPTPAPVAAQPAAPVVATKAPTIREDPYSQKHRGKSRGKPLLVAAGIAVAIALAAGGYYWQDARKKSELQAAVAAKLAQASALAEANNETGAITALREAQALAPANAEIPAEITRLEQRALNRRFAGYLAELKGKGELARPGEAELLVTQTLESDPANESARALRLAMETAQRRRETAQKAEEETRLAEQARVARLREQESAAAKAEAESARRNLQIVQLKLRVLQADSPEKIPAATQALDELRALAPADPEVAALSERLVALAKPKEPPPEPKPAPVVSATPPQQTAPVPDRRTLPQLIASVAPDYPRDMLRSRTSGKVELSFIVEADGTVGAVQVVSSTRKSFADAAVAAVKKYRFKPATLNGQPIAARVVAPIEFNPPR